MINSDYAALRQGLETAFIDGATLFVMQDVIRG